MGLSLQLRTKLDCLPCIRLQNMTISCPVALTGGTSLYRPGPPTGSCRQETCLPPCRTFRQRRGTVPAKCFSTTVTSKLQFVASAAQTPIANVPPPLVLSVSLAATSRLPIWSLPSSIQRQRFAAPALLRLLKSVTLTSISIGLVPRLVWTTGQNPRQRGHLIQL